MLKISRGQAHATWANPMAHPVNPRGVVNHRKTRQWSTASAAVYNCVVKNLKKSTKLKVCAASSVVHVDTGRMSITWYSNTGGNRISLKHQMLQVPKPRLSDLAQTAYWSARVQRPLWTAKVQNVKMQKRKNNSKNTNPTITTILIGRKVGVWRHLWTSSYIRFIRHGFQLNRNTRC